MTCRTRPPKVESMLQAIFDAADAMTASGQEPRRHQIESVQIAGTAEGFGYLFSSDADAVGVIAV